MEKATTPTREQVMDQLYGKPKALVGMVHVRALPGSPAAVHSLNKVAEIAVEEAKLFERLGFDGIMIENMHDRPYIKGGDPATTAAMTRVGCEVRAATKLPLGVQILAAAHLETLSVAHAIGATFMRGEAFVFGELAHSGLLDACAAELLRYRRQIGAEKVRIFTDIKKKHASHAITADLDISQIAREAQRYLADGLIVSGDETGAPTDADQVRAVAEAVNLPVVIGSGITAENVGQYLPAADVLIVGSYVKLGGEWSNEVDPQACERLVNAFQKWANE